MKTFGSACNTSVPRCQECHRYKSEAIKIRNVLSQSLKQNQQFMEDANTSMHNIKSEYEESLCIAEEENGKLKEQVDLLLKKIEDLQKLNTEEVKRIEEKINHTEKELEEITKKKPINEPAYKRLYALSKTKPTTLRKSLPKSELP